MEIAEAAVSCGTSSPAEMYKSNPVKVGNKKQNAMICKLQELILLTKDHY